MTPSNTVDRWVSWTRRPKPPSQSKNPPAMRRPENLFFINPRRSIGHQRLSNRSSYLDLASQFSPTSTIGQKILLHLHFLESCNSIKLRTNKKYQLPFVQILHQNHAAQTPTSNNNFVPIQNWDNITFSFFDSCHLTKISMPHKLLGKTKFSMAACFLLNFTKTGTKKSTFALSGSTATRQTYLSMTSPSESPMTPISPISNEGCLPIVEITPPKVKSENPRDNLT